jgi:hypothetical protein
LSSESSNAFSFLKPVPSFTLFKAYAIPTAICKQMTVSLFLQLPYWSCQWSIV